MVCVQRKLDLCQVLSDFQNELSFHGKLDKSRLLNCALMPFEGSRLNKSDEMVQIISLFSPGIAVHFPYFNHLL